jgi:ferredoxin, 2Fe-2S
MPKITYVEHDGTRHLVEVESGLSVMQGAVREAIPGIEANCGGSCACGTCHVYVDPQWSDRIPPPALDELGILEFVLEPADSSRLSCQIVVSAELDGLVVRLPEKQL